MKRKACFWGVSVVLAGIWLIGDFTLSEAASDDYDKKIQDFFKMIKGEKVSEAIDFIYSDNPFIQRTPDAVQNVKDQMLRLQNLIGKYMSNEKMIEKSVAGRFVYISYFVAYERQPLRFVF